MPRSDVVEDLRTARANLLDALDDLTDDHMHQAGAVGIWSIKDVLAHLTAWEAELVTTLNRLDHYKRQAPPIVEIERRAISCQRKPLIGSDS
jgi:uncharacterized damage-inducible protein DinB